MNIKKAKEEIKYAIQAYLAKDEFGEYRIPAVRQRPVLLMGAPGIGKTAVMEQVARECGVALVSYSITHHTRQSAIGLPFISKKEYGGKEYFSIPSPEKLASLTGGDLAPIRLGYRAPYLVKAAAQFIEEGGPDAVQTRLTAAEDPIGQLQKFCGIGPKVASCISLFGLGRTDAFPIDVWMRRVMNRLYGIEEKDMKSMASYAAEHFGKYGGIAQQYLFYYIRSL